MSFTLVWMRGPTPLGTKSFERLPDATTYAEANLGSIQANFNATAVKIVGVDGTPHYLKSLSR